MVKSIKGKLIYSFFAVMALFFVLLSGYTMWFFYHYNLDVMTQQLNIAARITEEVVAGYLTGHMSAPALDERIKDLGTRLDRRMKTRITVTDQAGQVIADSWENPAMVGNLLARPEVATALAGHQGAFVRNDEMGGTRLLYVALPVQADNAVRGVVRVGTTLDGIVAAFAKIAAAFFGFTLLAALLCAILAWHLLRRFTAPVEAITLAAQKIAQGDLSHRVYIRTGDEMTVLANTINELAGNLDDKVNEMAEEKGKLELVLENMDNAVVLLDRYGRVTMANKTAVEQFGISSALLGKHNIQVIGNSMLDESMRRVVASNESCLIDIRTNIQGHKRAYQAYLAPVASGEDGGVGSVLVVFHDVTTLQELHERQTEFIANASHELSTPLTTIKGFAETLLDGAAEDPVTARHFIGIIHEEAERMHRLIRDLLDVAKLDSREYHQHVNLQDVLLGDILDEAVQEMAPNWQRKKHAVRVEHPAVPLHVLADRDLLKQVVLNLLDNAVKYTSEGGRIALQYWRREQDAVVMVKDNGIGIPPQDVPLIFDRFYRVDKARSRSAGGTGLGLSIVKFIVEAMGGKVEVRSALNVGTTFYFTVPLAKEAEK